MRTPRDRPHNRSLVDGGCIRQSVDHRRHLGSFATYRSGCLMSPRDREVVHEVAGVRGCKKPRFPSVTNNVAELIAAHRGDRAAPRTGRGVIYSDSTVTPAGWQRVCPPQRARLALQRCRAALRRPRPSGRAVVLAGHPTVEELANGRARHGGARQPATSGATAPPARPAPRISRR